jgi:chromosome segregation ATPase
MVTAENTEPMRRARRADSERKRRLVLAATDAQLEAGRHPTIAGIARQAGVGRKFIYDHPDLRAGIELKAAQATRRQASDLIASARVTGASLRADLENARAQNHRLSKQIRALENRLSQAEGARLVADELLPEGVLAQLADQQLAARVAELDQQLFEAREDLRRTSEQLEAARTINRELMQQANRSPHQPSS